MTKSGLIRTLIAVIIVAAVAAMLRFGGVIGGGVKGDSETIVSQSLGSYIMSADSFFTYVWLDNGMTFIKASSTGYGFLLAGKASKSNKLVDPSFAVVITSSENSKSYKVVLGYTQTRLISDHKTVQEGLQVAKLLVEAHKEYHAAKRAYIDPEEKENYVKEVLRTIEGQIDTALLILNNEKNSNKPFTTE